MFWNTQQTCDINPIIIEISREKEIDIIVLAEYSDDKDSMCSTLGMKPYIGIGCEKIIAIGKRDDVQPGLQSTRYSIQIINNKYILCAMHLPSNIVSGSEGRRSIVIQQLVHDLKEVESSIKSSNSIIFGDFNVDPYDSGCISADHFHGLPCYDDASRSSRIIEGMTFKFFYNPMWNLFGDFDKPPGTYYYSGSTVKCTYWHIFDQVMIRPCLRKQFVDKTLEIVTHTSSFSLIDNKGHPNRKYSDHLPIVFEIKE